ncbi:MAG: pentapeptide repeat-containing protein [Bacteroidota bacterium]
MGKVIFDSAHFEGDADFAFTEFSDEVSFEKEVRFDKHVTFGGARFLKKVSFQNALFLGETYFGYTRFSEVNFSYARFFDRTFFDGDENNRVFSEHHHTSMVSVLFQKPDQVLFRIVNLTKCSLINTDLSKVELTDVKWSYKRTSLDKRKVIYDEISTESNKNYPLIEKVYCQLKKNYEDRGNYAEAGNFHYGEMEMRRLAYKSVFRFISLTACYKYLSGYCEKYWRALFWLAVFLILFSGSYLAAGIKLQAGSSGSSPVIWYPLTLNPAALFTTQFWQNFSYSMLHTFEAATFQKDRTFTTVNQPGRFL